MDIAADRLAVRRILDDHEKLLAGAAGKHADFGWDDFVPAIREDGDLGRQAVAAFRIA